MTQPMRPARGVQIPPPPPGWQPPDVPPDDTQPHRAARPIRYGCGLFGGAVLGVVILAILLCGALAANQQTIGEFVDGILTPPATYTLQYTYTPPWTFTPQLTFTAQATYTVASSYTPQWTYTPQATFTVQPTYTPPPTYTYFPTLTPQETYTPAPTYTPLPTYTPVVVVPGQEQLVKLQTLTTIRIAYSEEVTTRTDMPALLSALYGENLALVAVGYIEAGIDMAVVQPTDVFYDPVSNVMIVRLPAPRLLVCYLDENQTYTKNRSSGVFAASSPALDAEARRFALRQFLERAIETGILIEAQTQAAEIVRQWVATFNAGVIPETNILVEVAPPDPNAPLPATCQ